MAYSNVEERGGFSVTSIAADKAGDAIDVRGCTRGSCQVVWKGATGGTAVFKLQQSNDGSTWSDISGKTATLTASTGSSFMELNDINGAYVRGFVTANAETTGDVTSYFMFKGR